jgi:hypothetical protein
MFYPTHTSVSAIYIKFEWLDEEKMHHSSSNAQSKKQETDMLRDKYQKKWTINRAFLHSHARTKLLNAYKNIID